MFLPLADLLNEDELTMIRHLVDDADFEEGAATAGWAARGVKENRQMTDGAHRSKINSILHQALMRSEIFLIAARPNQIHPFLVTQTPTGGQYGTHVDNALMGNDTPLRSDLSITVFLNDPKEYAGGELVMEDASQERSYKLPAGCAILYPSTTLHRVEPVRNGNRLVACSWIQSLIRDAQQREILFDLDTVRRSLFAKDGKTAEFDLLSKTQSNLLRRWCDL